MSHLLIENKIKIEQLNILYRHMLIIIISTSLVTTGVVYVLWGRLNSDQLIGFLCSVYTINIIRFIDLKWLWEKQIASQKINLRIKLITIYSGINGCIWGLAALFLLDINDPFTSLLITATILALGSASASSFVVVFPAFLAYSVPSLTLFAFKAFSFNDEIYAMLGVFSLLFLTTTILFTRTGNQSATESIRLRFENASLLEGLKEQKRISDQAREKAEQANTAKSKFIAAASHDLRQPLHALSLFIDAAKNLKEGNERTTIFSRIDHSLEALRKLFDALLDISRLDAKVITPEFQHFNIAKLFDTLQAEFSAQADAKNLTLKVYCSDIIIISDKLLLERILRNLIGNAIRYTQVGGLLLSCRLRKNKVLLQVWDTGIGIAKVDQTKVFIEFQQLHNQHRNRELGLGLGLALVRRMSALLKHDLTLSSQPAQGSVFSLTVEKGDKEYVVADQIIQSTQSWNVKGIRILIIDDEKDVLHAMQSVLKKWGCYAVYAESLSEAINMMKEHHFVPEIILSDLRLKTKETGIDVINHLRHEYGEDIVGILISGDTAPERIEEVKQSGYELLQKPVRPAHLRSILRQSRPCDR